MKIRDLPDLEKPRERLCKYGTRYLSNEELIAILLRTGDKGVNVKELSNNVLVKLKNISDIDKMTVNELTSIKGIGKVKAITLLAAAEFGKRVMSKSFNENVVLSNAKVINDYFANMGLSGQMLGINVVDHIITNGKEFYSFYEEMSKNEA